MDHDTHLATIWDHIHPANTALANDINCKTSAFKHDPMHLWCTDILLTGEVVVVTDLFNGKRASELMQADVQRTEPDEPGARQRPRGGHGASRFCRFPAFDQGSSLTSSLKMSELLLMVLQLGKSILLPIT